MRAVFAALALIPASALATITISGPSSSAYWVQHTANNISWSSSGNDPATVDVIVTNPDNTTLNGDFFIQRALNVSTGFTVITNVTLKVGTGYQVVFVNATNSTQFFANSSSFEVKAPGTAPAPAPSSGSSGNGSSSTSPSGSSGSASGSASATASASSSSTSSAASSLTAISSANNVLFALGACALSAVGAAFL